MSWDSLSKAGFSTPKFWVELGGDASYRQFLQWMRDYERRKRIAQARAAQAEEDAQAEAEEAERNKRRWISRR